MSACCPECGACLIPEVEDGIVRDEHRCEVGRKPLVYVAGPVTGDPWGCVKKATVAYRWLRSLGVVPFLPQLSVLHEMVDPQPYEEWLRYDFEVIANCDGLLRLPGESRGADAEVDFANRRRIPVWFMDDSESRSRLIEWADAW